MISSFNSTKHFGVGPSKSNTAPGLERAYVPSHTLYPKLKCACKHTHSNSVSSRSFMVPVVVGYEWEGKILPYLAGPGSVLDCHCTSAPPLITCKSSGGFGEMEYKDLCVHVSLCVYTCACVSQLLVFLYCWCEAKSVL